MSDSPINQVAIGSLFRLNGQPVFPALSPNDEFYHHSLPALDATGKPVIELGRAIESNKVLIDEPAVLVSKLNPRKPRVAVVVPKADERHCASTEFMCFVPRDRRDDLRYWAYYLGSTGFSVRLQRVAIGSTNSHTRASPSEVMRWVVPNPSHEEKRAIAGVLESLDTTIRQTEAIIAKLKLVKQGLLHDLLTRGIDANGELRPPQSEAPHLYKASPLGWIPREWEVVKLSAMTAPDSPITYGVVKPGPEVDGGIAFIRGGDIFGGRILVEQLRTIGADVSREYRRTLLRGGELLMSLVGYPGEVAVVPPSLAGANIARQAALIRLQQHTNASYVMNYLSSAGGKMQVLASSLGSAQQVVNLSDLRSVCVPLPTPAEQEEICVRLAATDAHLAREAEALEKLRSLKSGLMDDLLTGRVRVTPLLEPQAT
jgi:type I restriction enzyme, S subunit